MRGARGPFSGREFDPGKAGGPIVSRSLADVTITPDAVAEVQAHLDRFGPDPFNDAMMARQRAIAAGRLDPSPADTAFHAHQLDEYRRYEALGWKTGLPVDQDAQAELWNHVHTAALEDYGMSEIETDPATERVRSTLYHRDCDPRLQPWDWTAPPGYPFHD